MKEGRKQARGGRESERRMNGGQPGKVYRASAAVRSFVQGSEYLRLGTLEGEGMAGRAVGMAQGSLTFAATT